MPFLEAGGQRLEYEWIGPGPAEGPTLVLLHSGLGSLATWKDFPAALAQATGLGALVYSRWGHGRSAPLDRPRALTFMHDEALETLPQLLTGLGVRAPILVGHSDGASIALIYAGSDRPGAAGPVPLGLALMAPHVFIEEASIQSNADGEEAYRRGGLAQSLGRYHDDPDGVFRGWTDLCLERDFRDWNIEAYLATVTCPVLVIQGEDDEYGTEKQVAAIEAQAGGPVETLMLRQCGHSPHQDEETVTLAAMARFVGRVAGRVTAA